MVAKEGLLAGAQHLNPGGVVPRPKARPQALTGAHEQEDALALREIIPFDPRTGVVERQKQTGEQPFLY